MYWSCHDYISFFIFREKETAILKEQINKLNNQIRREESKAQDLKIRAK
jgi:hypothetical protein